MTGVPEGRIAAGSEHVSQHLVVAVQGYRDRHCYLDLQASVHVDQVVLPEGMPGGRYVPLT